MVISGTDSLTHAHFPAGTLRAIDATAYKKNEKVEFSFPSRSCSRMRWSYRIRDCLALRRSRVHVLACTSPTTKNVTVPPSFPQRAQTIRSTEAGQPAIPHKNGPSQKKRFALS